MKTKTFFLKLFFLLLLITLSLYIPITYFSKKGIDEYYTRFTQPDNKNLVLGSSRAAQAFNPEELFEKNGFNFSFTHSVSPYGKVYTDAIKKIISPGKGTVILEVCPMQFSEYQKKADDENKFRENELMLGNMMFYGIDPNAEYLLKNFKKPLYRLFLDEKYRKKHSKLHENGWLEVYNAGQTNYSKKLKKNCSYFQNIFKQMKPSLIRKKRCMELIDWLKSEHKAVILVRTPIANQLIELEKNYWPEFQSEMMDLSKKLNVPYFDFSSDTTFTTHDGNHLDSRSAKQFSRRIKTTIKRK